MTTTAPTGAHDELERGLSNRHLQLIAIGGAIGTGLFLGSGKVISLTGPSVLFIYAVIGCMMFLLMRALGELLLSNLNYKTFGDIAKDLIGPWAGYFVSWTYWITWVVICVADIIAITSYVAYINADIPAWLPALISVAALTILNLQPVRFFGEFEFWFSIDRKIVAILALIATGIVLIVSGFTNPETPAPRLPSRTCGNTAACSPFGASRGSSSVSSSGSSRSSVSSSSAPPQPKRRIRRHISPAPSTRSWCACWSSTSGRSR